MGRPEKPLNAAVGPIAGFANDLRKLRVEAGRPSYREMARVALSSPSVLSSASSGHRLPTLPVALAFVESCGGDLAAWENRWRAIAGQAGRTLGFGRQQLPATAVPPTASRAELGEGAPADRPLPPYPVQLPMRPLDFVGRDIELATARKLAAPSGAIGIPLMISGQIGVGKSAFALTFAHELSTDVPDGQLYADLSFDEPDGASSLAVVTGFLQALGVPAQQIPTDPTQRTGLYRSLLTQRRMLVLLDNARDEHQVRPLLTQAPHSQILVTSRSRLLGLDGVSRIELDVLVPDESVAIIGALAGEDRIRSDHEASVRLAELCCGLPLALNIIGRKIAARPGWTVAYTASQLAEDTRLLDRLRIGDVSVRGRLMSAYQRLAPLARLAFHYLNRDCALNANGLAALLNIPVDSGEDLLELFVDAGLLRRPTVTGRYGILPLVRLFAAEQPASHLMEQRPTG